MYYTSRLGSLHPFANAPGFARLGHSRQNIPLNRRRCPHRYERRVKKECGATREHSGVACRDAMRMNGMRRLVEAFPDMSNYLKRYSWSLTNSRDGTPPRIHPLTAAPST